MADRNRNARLACRGVGTLDLPWWPSDVSRTARGVSWTQEPRPGKFPLLLADGKRLAEYRVSYLLRQVDRTQSVVPHLGLLDRMVQSKTPVTLWLGKTNRGLYQITDLSIVEVEWTPDGSPTVADVSLTLVAASTVTLNVGPVKK